MIYFGESFPVFLFFVTVGKEIYHLTWTIHLQWISYHTCIKSQLYSSGPLQYNICASNLYTYHIQLYIYLAEEGQVHISWEPGVHIIHHIGWGQPVELEREINSTANSNGAEQIVQDMTLLACQGKPKLPLLETINLQQRKKMFAC